MDPPYLRRNDFLWLTLDRYPHGIQLQHIMMARTLLLFAFVLVFGASRGIRAQTWEMTGLTGRSCNICVDDTLIYYGANGGLYRSSDGGNSWTVVRSTPSYRVETVAAHGNVLFTIDEVQHIYQSLDGGKSWAAFPNSQYAQHIAYTERGFLLGTYGKISRSVDGIKWTDLCTKFDKISITSFAAHGDTIIAADGNGSSSGGAVISSDDGATWAHYPSTGLGWGVYARDVAFAPDGSVYLSSDFGVERTTDLGKHWVRRDTGLADIGSSYWPSANAIACLGDTMYAGSGHWGLYRSIDAGRTWNDFGNGLYQYQMTRQFARWHNDILAATTDGLYVLRSGSTVWRSLNANLPAANYIYKLLPAFGKLYAATVGDYGPCWTEDQGKHWTRDYAAYFTYGYMSSGCYDLAVNDSGIWAVSETDVVYQSRDSGRSWFSKSISAGRFAQYDNRLYITRSPKVLRTSDFFKSFDTIRVPLQSSYSTVWHILDALGGLFASTTEGLFRSTDDGRTWTRDSTAIGKRTTLSAAVKDGYLFAGTDSGLYRSTDAGAHWQRMQGALPDTNVVCFLVNDSLLLAGTSLGVFRSTDLGVSWFRLGQGAADSKEIWSMCLYNGFLFASNLDRSFGANVFRLQMDPDAGVRMSEGGTRVSVRPNPARSSIELPVPSASASVIRIFTEDGQELLAFTLEAGNQGVIRLDVSRLPAGAYLFTVRSGQQTEAHGKFMIVR